MMATNFHPSCSRAAGGLPLLHRIFKTPVFVFTRHIQRKCNNRLRISRIKAASDGGDSYLSMWRKAVERERKTVEFENIAEKSAEASVGEGEGEGERKKEESEEELERRRNNEFGKLLEVSVEERDRVQRMQVIDRAAAAIAAARSLLKKNLPLAEEVSGEVRAEKGGEDMEDRREGNENGSSLWPQSGNSSVGAPGPSFWSWSPPLPDDDHIISEIEIHPARQPSSSPAQGSPVKEKERGLDFLSIPFETSMLQNNSSLPFPPLQSLVEVENVGATQETPHLKEEQEIEVQFSTHAAEATDALIKLNDIMAEGVNADGTRWWKETGVETRADGVVCKWTLIRGVSADEATEWENKYWEAADELGNKELGSEKSGRDAFGDVWREYWRESMMQIEGQVHLEKTADKWGKNVRGEEWQEQWWEHYGASGQAEKWAHKWCSIDPNSPLEAGHAHVWHERWGEKYDGEGGSIKYADKWAERNEGDGWSKWGDKWDEHFNPSGHGVKQGESWWAGKYGDRWNRTWGEGHNGSGWVHKYGKSSSGEHWDTHEPQETWYEKFPHYGFYHCFENSVQLREVKPPSEWQ